MTRGSRLLELVAVMDRLRSPGGCPWDAEQTHESLVQYLVEETYETIEAIDADDRDALIEELGDLLLQVVFHARIGQESDAPFDIDDVADALVRKLGNRATRRRRLPGTWKPPGSNASAGRRGARLSQTESPWRCRPSP